MSVVILITGRDDDDNKLIICSSLEKAKEWLVSQLRLFYTKKEGLFKGFTPPNSHLFEGEYVLSEDGASEDGEPEDVSTFGLDIDGKEAFSEFIVPNAVPIELCEESLNTYHFYVRAYVVIRPKEKKLRNYGKYWIDVRIIDAETI